ncbi:hypothetical protein WR25_23214 [Diploscapter pachys]|uniref:Uncharacterized protein n=1 Tax=Diploscapter pachys TaxID=2018661 RepID=A0A2A2JJQ7_9BILA|nr:hypothetical protein WR25_23214 [Diploscapter pachys]
MWPRGFPLEYFSRHNHTDANFRLCEVQKRAAVQQGLVDMDPDVDAIFRLLNVNPKVTSSEHFNMHAPPIILGQHMYSPWNSQNTLFHKNAFFTMFLPTTVSFREMGFWLEKDVEFVRDWMHDLVKVGYSFPKRPKPTAYEMAKNEDDKTANCRRMFLQLFNDKPIESTKQALIIVCNNPMDLAYGYSILQRLYTPYFAAVIFCGSWYPEKQNFNRSDMPPLQYPFNYIHITPEEINRGYNGEVCMIRAYQLGLRNIKGYFAVADDSILNFWQSFNLDMVFHQWGLRLAATGRGPWWPRSIALFPLSGVGYLPSVMGQTAYPCHIGLVARPEDRLLLCATVERF